MTQAKTEGITRRWRSLRKIDPRFHKKPKWHESSCALVTIGTVMAWSRSSWG